MATKKSVQTNLVETTSRYFLANSPLKDTQILKLFARTPKQYKYKRPAKGGGEWEYAKGSYFAKVLNYVFGFLWDFEVINEKEAHGQIVVHGRLTINYYNEKTGEVKKLLSKDQYGRADIKYKKDTDIALDYGNDHKAAATDAFKKCASALGIAGDIYSKEEFKDIQDEGGREADTTPPPVEGDIDDTQKAALESLGIDPVKHNIKTKEQALKAINEATAKKKGAK